MIKNILKKPFYYTLIFVAVLVIVWINKNYSSRLKLDLNNIPEKQERKQEDKSSDLFQPIELSMSTSEQTFDTSSDISNSNSQIKKENKLSKIKNLEKNSMAIKNITTLKCQPLKENDRVFFFKQSGFYGEIYTSQDKSFYLFYDNCLWLWSKSKKTGLKICSKEINVPLTNFNPEIIRDEEINKVLKEKKLNISCHKTQINETKFLPPSGIEFLPIDPSKENLLNIF